MSAEKHSTCQEKNCCCPWQQPSTLLVVVLRSIRAPRTEWFRESELVPYFFNQIYVGHHIAPKQLTSLLVINVLGAWACSLRSKQPSRTGAPETCIGVFFCVSGISGSKWYYSSFLHLVVNIPSCILSSSPDSAIRTIKSYAQETPHFPRNPTKVYLVHNTRVGDTA